MIDTKLLQKKILDLAIRGKLVPQDPTDEPAGEILAQLSTSHKSHFQIAAVPFEIPSGWKWCALGNLASIIGGVSYDKKDVSASGIRILRGGNIQNGELLLNSDDVFLPQKYNDDANSVKKGDILIVGSTGSETLIGKAGFAMSDFESTQIGAFLRIVRPNSAELINYLHLIFKSDYYANYIRNKAKGTNINNIKVNYLNDFAVPIPPLAEQKRITNTTTAFAIISQIESEQTALTYLATLTKSKILDLAMRGKLVPQDPNDEPASELLVRLSTSHKSHYEKLTDLPYEVPPSWSWLALKSVCWLDNGTEQNGENLPYLDVRYLRGRKDGVIKNGGIILNAGDKVILVDGQNSGEVFDIAERGYMGSTFRIIRQSPAINAKFLQLFIDLHRKMLRDNKTGSAIPHLNKKIFASLPIAIPPLAEQERMVAQVGLLLQQIQMLQE